MSLNKHALKHEVIDYCCGLINTINGLECMDRCFFRC